MYYVYLLQNKEKNFLYIGSTPNLKERFNQHQKGLVRSTKFYLPSEIVYVEIYKSKQDALTREHRLKYYGKALSQLKKRIKDSLG